MWMGGASLIAGDANEWTTADDLEALLRREQDLWRCVFSQSDQALSDFALLQAHYIDVFTLIHNADSVDTPNAVFGSDVSGYVVQSVDHSQWDHTVVSTVVLVPTDEASDATQSRIVWTTTWVQSNGSWWILNSHASKAGIQS